MGLQFHRLQWGYIFLMIFFILSCSLQAVKKPEGEKGFFQETSRLERLAREDSNKSVRAQSHLQLAFLYVNYRNPQLNYTRALQEMENYLSLTPDKAQTNDFQNWLAVLKEVNKLQTNLEKTQKVNKNLREEVTDLQKVNKSLRDEVTDLKETIEKLKALDRLMEERRRLTK
jgi:predicted  nucleic acid-binding Zn-ribbon protein